MNKKKLLFFYIFFFSSYNFSNTIRVRDNRGSIITLKDDGKTLEIEDFSYNFFSHLINMFNKEMISLIDNFILNIYPNIKYSYDFAKKYKYYYIAGLIYLYLGKKINNLAKQVNSNKYFSFFLSNKKNEINYIKTLLKNELNCDILAKLKEMEDTINFFKKYKMFLYFFCLPPFLFQDTKQIAFSIDIIEDNFETIMSYIYSKFNPNTDDQ